jgi:hypothetical protein
VMKKWWIHRCCGDVHGCRWFFLTPVDLLFRDILKYPHDTKKRPMSRHNLRLPPWRNIAGICIGFELEEHLCIQNGGGPSITVFFFLIWHSTHDGCLAMNAPSQKVGVHMILYFIVDSI